MVLMNDNNSKVEEKELSFLSDGTSINQSTHLSRLPDNASGNQAFKKKFFTHFAQLCRFGIIGIIAAAVHFCSVVYLVQMFAVNPLIANIFAFIIAFQVSYLGHSFWTFANTTKDHRYVLPRLFLLQCVIFAINESSYAFFMSYGLSYKLALILVLTILPLITFTIAKLWIF